MEGMAHIRQILPKLHLERSPQDTPDPKNTEQEQPTSEQIRADYLKAAGVLSLSHTFENIRQPKGYDKVYQAFTEITSGNVDWFMLLVYGGSGNGKTLACEAAVIKLYDRGIKARRERWADIVRFTLKAAMNNHKPDAETYENIFKRLRERRTLIIDDVGMGSTGGNWEWGELEDILDYRLEHGLFTIMTTNLDLKEIPPRIISRFRDAAKCRMVFNEAADQRPQNKGSKC